MTRVDGSTFSRFLRLLFSRTSRKLLCFFDHANVDELVYFKKKKKKKKKEKKKGGTTAAAQTADFPAV